MKGKSHIEIGRRDRDAVWPGPTFLALKPIRQKGCHSFRGSPELRASSLTLGSPAQVNCTRETSLHKIWLCKPTGLTSKRAKGLQETKTLLLKSRYKTSVNHVLVQRQQSEKHLSHMWRFID